MTDVIYLGKCIEHAKVNDMYDSNLWLDISFPHVLYLCGTRGSGKSFGLGVMIEGLGLASKNKVTTQSQPITTVVFDLQNQFWTLGYKPDPGLWEDAEHIKLIHSWQLEPTSLQNIRLFLPQDEKPLIGLETTFSISLNELNATDLCSLWQTDVYSPQGHLVNLLVEKVSETGYKVKKTGVGGKASHESVKPKESYELADLLHCLRNDNEILDNIQPQVRDAVQWRLQSLQKTGLFQAHGTPISDLLKEGQISVLMLRSLDDATKALVAGFYLRKIYTVMGEYHTKRKIYRRIKKTVNIVDTLPARVWVAIDEAHVICPSDFETSATRSLIEYVKRGRDAGLSLALATQQPAAVDARILSQVDFTMIFRLTFDGDINAALARIPAYLPNSFGIGSSEKEPRAIVRLLESGEAIIGDSQADRAFIAMIRPRVSAHGGREPR